MKYILECARWIPKFTITRYVFDASRDDNIFLPLSPTALPRVVSLLFCFFFLSSFPLPFELLHT